ncbi:hypothetical protein A2480_01875 [Candidatus Uhrbacteria bacterium RIFOXYC2_FULL_47_19]|uniref:Uncharacterized protein n=1 Tax=Candidatus Uhrbacteria bacterium RIFOXYC2_FULL_47_19 TaxID=1802424 RepID=A0A1F7WEJ9_9BACT|nr:MAG: hypothetical protein A2480_01875 [Candidatus Uhrbacteria bacterium RIFOXYC2_FULL_47_19]HCC22219.1 hypothetical protein [Candidatus Uhrbacteria bacterium]
MFLAVHATAGALLGSVVVDPATSFSLSFLSHFFLDMIPHGDQYLYDQYKRGDKVNRAVIRVLIDALVTAILVFVLLSTVTFASETGVIAGIIGGLLPDLLVGLFEMFKPKGRRWTGRQLLKFNDLHMRNHVFLIRKFFRGDISSRFGLVVQVLVLGLVVRWLL